MFLAFNSMPADPISIYDKSPTVCEDGKASCDGCRKQKVACDLSGRKPHEVKAKWKGRSIIDSDDDA